ncbi:MAG: CapA family protein [Bifidobacterium tibiigranuli]|jgi:poly-gamma-glutamate synthesis protein (capsule biosynthesis protein)|nr:CapA family protein [Bifidobacterium tibiigranuli]
MDTSLGPELTSLVRNIAATITGNESAVIDTLRSVSTGELAMVETLTDTEKDVTRQFFAWVASVGPARVWKSAVSVVPAVMANMGTEAGRSATHDPEEIGGAIMQQLREAFQETDSGSGNLPDLNRLGQIVREAKGAYREHGLLGLAVITVSYVCYEQFHYPQPETGVYDIANSMFDKLKWLYRYWYNQLEVAETRSGLENFFRAQVLENRFPIDGSAVEPARHLTISCAGDLLAVDTLLTGNTDHLFDGIADFYRSADIVSANLESTVYSGAQPGRAQAPGEPAQMNTSEAMLAKFRGEGSINFFSTATNHANDWGTAGILDTISALERAGGAFSGTAASVAQRDDVTIVEHDGIKVALLAYTFDLNGRAMPADEPYLANEVRFNDVRPAPDYSLIERHIALARQRGAEFIVAYCHWGWEFEMYPHTNITEAAHRIVDLGVDVILGNHPHVPQPAQVIDRGAGRPKALVFYAFGDFVSYHPYSRNSKLAYAVKFDVAKVTTASRSYVSWDHLTALPIYIVNARNEEGSYDCRIVAFDDVLANPDGYGLTDREKSELPHLHDVVWKQTLSPLSHIPSGGWSDR